MRRAVILGVILYLTGPHPEALAQRLLDRWRQDHDYVTCVARAGQDDWMCETIYEHWPATRGAEQIR